MRKNIIKGAVGVIVFFVVLIVSSIVTNQGNSNTTVEMSAASLPLVRIVEGTRHINTLHGYVKEVEGEYQKDHIFVLGSERNVSIAIEKFGAAIKSIGFEVRSIDSERLVENTEITGYSEDKDEITAQFTIKDLIDADTEYMLILLVRLEDGRTVRYYTRFIQGTDYHQAEMLSFVEDFHTRTFDKEAAKEITKYLESNSDGDNTTYAAVDIHSSFSQITWGDLSVKKETQPETTIRDITGEFGVFEVSYLVSMQEGGEKKYYKINEKYRVRYGIERMYLLDFKRSMNVIFTPKDSVYTANKISIGIASPDIELVECEGGNIFAFTQSERLYAYNVADNKIATIFSFYDEENADLRTLYDKHKIKILSVEESGNVRFMVYGYMNRGEHEGNIGIQVYYYNSILNTIEEEVYIPYTKSYELLHSNLQHLSYVNSTNHFFLILDGTLYDVDLLQKSYEQVASDLSTDSFQVSKSNRMVVWQNSSDPNACDELCLMNLSTRSRSLIKAENNQYIKPLGFMGEDLIYGIASRQDLATDGYGGILFPMNVVKIQDENGDVLKTYSQDGIFVVDAQIAENQINLQRVKREGTDVGEEELNMNTVSENDMEVVAYTTDDYTIIADDQIVNTIVEPEGNNVIEVVATKDYEKIIQIAAKRNIEEKSLKFLKPKEVAFEGGREVMLENESEVSYYYVYGPYGLERICENESEAVSYANELFGMVYDEAGNYLFRKGTLKNKNQIMKIEPDRESEERSSLAVCLDTMLLAEGVTKNSAYLLQNGETVFSILEENLESAKVLDLTGCQMDVILYYINQDIPVLALLDNREAVLVVGFNEMNTVLMDPATGTIYKKGMNDSREFFEEAGNRFITFVRKD